MPNFEVFHREQLRPVETSTVTIRANGGLSLNGSAYRSIDKPVWVELLSDREAKLIGIREAAGPEAASAGRPPPPGAEGGAVSVHVGADHPHTGPGHRRDLGAGVLAAVSGLDAFRVAFAGLGEAFAALKPPADPDRETPPDDPDRKADEAHKRTGVEETVTAMRSWWAVQPAPHFTLDARSWLPSTIPPMPALAEAAVRSLADTEIPEPTR